MKINEVNLIKGNVEYHKQLNDLVWFENSMNPKVRRALLNIAKIFVEYLDIKDFKISDIVLAGSMANYNYTKYSDFDLHIVTNYQDLGCDDLAETLYKAKKQIWNDLHDINIYDHEVELYVEDVKTPPVSGGIYSILKNRWVKEPERIDPSYSQRAVNIKAQSLIDAISKTLKSADSDNDFQRLIDKIRKMRQSGLDTGGEFSTENLAFKIIRNLGWMEKLYQGLVDFQDQKLSIG
jgi:predicted nucleotidyltransferase